MGFSRGLVSPTSPDAMRTAWSSAQPDAPPSADPDSIQHAPGIVPNTRLAMLHNEYQISQPFKTKVHFKLGLPRHTVILTNRRMIVSCKQRFFFFFKHEWETSVLYKDVVDISIGHCRDRKALAFAMLCLAFGAILGVVCITSGQLATGITMLALFWAIALCAVATYLAEEYLAEGDDLLVDVCKSGRAVASWPGTNAWHASKTLMIRLPSAQAYTAMYTLLEHPEVTMLQRDAGDAAAK